VDAVNAWPLDLPLLRLSPRPQDVWTLNDATGGVLVMGETRSGKTTGSGRRLALNYLRAGFGGLVLCFRVNEAALWCGYLKEAGREQDGRFFGVGEPHRFNFLDYESRVSGVDWVGNVVNLLLDVGSIQRRTESTSAEAHFWLDQKTKLLTNSITLLMLAGEPVQLRTLYQLIVDAPRSEDQTRNATWKQNSLVWSLLTACEKKAGSHPEYVFLKRYWLKELPALHAKQRESVFADFSGMFDPLSRFAFGELFCTTTNLTPDDILNGAVVVVDLPVAKYRRVGQYAALIWSQLFQRATDRREYRAPESRPAFLWQDEAQHFTVEQDATFQTTAGGQGLLAVRLTQNLPNFLDAFGPAGKNKVDTLLGNHAGLKVFHRNGDPETNQWASRVIAKETQYRASVSSGYSSGLTGYNVTVNEVEEDSCPPKTFIGLKNGGPLNRWIVEGVVFQSGRLIDGQRWVIRRWKQK
jgi:type IV secretory pathway TraG/TraD family ATPase VirD4